MKLYHLEKRDVPANMRNFFRYRGNKFRMYIKEKVSLNNMQWDGGSRSQYMIVNLKTMQSGQITDSRPYPENLKPMDEITLIPDSMVVEHSVFCGKNAGITFHIHPSNASLLLPEPDGELTREEKIVLAYTSSLKSSYGGIKQFRYSRANQQTGITWEAWLAAKDSLIEKGLLRKNGAITSSGRNQDTSEFRPY